MFSMMLMILVSSCSIYDQVSYQWEQLELAAELQSDIGTLWTGAGSGLLISRLEKINLFCLTVLITLVLLMGKWMGLFLEKNNLLR